jgi:prepilin-type N-terminal cleavage/methylation domain-containing protein
VRARRSRGFTLIELIAVCTIVALLVGVAAIRLDYVIPKYRLRGAGREVAAVLRQAKARAAATGKEVFVEIDLSKGTYWILSAFPKLLEDGREAEPKAYEYQRVFLKQLPEDVEFTDVVFGSRDKVDRGTARVRLSPLGASSHAIVNLRNRDRLELAVRLNGFTGHVAFYDEHKDADELLEDREP